MHELDTLQCVLILVGLVVIGAIPYGLYLLWLRIRPEALTPPTYWPNKRTYDRASKLVDNILFWPTKLGFAGDLWIKNLWLPSVILVPFMLPIAVPVWLVGSLPNH